MIAENLGQHFLEDDEVLDSITQTAGVGDGDTVLEIGPGKGVLTERLLDANAHVTAVEKDPDLYEDLQDTFRSAISTDRLELVNQDIRDFNLETLPANYKVVASIPYYLTSQLLRSLLTADNKPQLMVMLVQKELAERITNTEKNSVLSVSVRAYGEPEYVTTVPKTAFRPAPDVDSAVLSIRNISDQFFRADGMQEDDFFRLVKTGFAHKRKQLANNLASNQGKSKKTIKNVLKDCHLQPTVRAEKLGVGDWKCVYKQLKP